MVNFMDLRKLSITNNHFIMVSISMLILLGFWQLISLFYPEQFLPSPVTTGRVILNLILERDAAYHIYVSLYRIVFSFIWSMLGGILIGIVMGVNRVAESLMRTWVVVGLTIPSLGWALLSLLWFGLGDHSAIIATTLTVTPFTIGNIWEGVKSVDRDLVEMAKVFKIRRLKVIYEIYIQSLLPFVFASARMAFSLAWKILVIVEMFGLGNGVGYMLNYSYGNFRIDWLMGWLILFICVMLLIEYLAFYPAARYLFRWRKVQIL